MNIFTRFYYWSKRRRLIARFQGLLRQWRLKRVSKRQTGALREFVYLDEVSVYSLVASRLGPIATEFTDKQVASLKSEIPKVIGGNLEASSQVVRKSIVQTTFKKLYELERESFVLRPVEDDMSPPDIFSLDELIELEKSLTAQGWIVDPENLARGQLIEIEVELEAEDIFRVGTVIWAFLDIVKDDVEMFGFDSDERFAQAATSGRILEKLLAGLVPVRGCAVDYQVVNLRGKECLVHRKLLEKLPGTESLCQSPLYIVGVAERSLFWKDVRRILFSKARFRVLCRLTQVGIQNSWSPVKLSHALSLVMPDLGKMIDNLGSVMQVSMSQAAKAGRSTDRNRQLMRQALVSYGQSLAAHYNESIAEQDLLDSSLLLDEQCDSYVNHQKRREAFDAVAAFVLNRFGIDSDPLVAAQYRSTALTDGGLDFSGRAMPLSVADETKSAGNPSDEDRFLDTEFVAIYW